MAILTINQTVDSVNNFINSVNDSKNSYYCFIGKATPWLNANGDIDEAAVPVTDNSVIQIEQSVYQNMVYAKKLTGDDISFLVKRHDWSNGTIYARYNNEDPNIYSKNFYVVTDSNDVYKCIYNGEDFKNTKGVPSKFKPSVNKVAGNFQTPDGYIWKYLYTIDSTVYTNFQTPDYIPVTPNNDVTTNAVPGTIDKLVMINGGNNYQVYEESFLDGFIDRFLVKLPANSSPEENFYTNSAIYLKAGFGAGQIRTITGYDSTNKILSVNPPFDYYENLKLDPLTINGGVNFTIGKSVEQLVTNLIYFYKTEHGYFNLGDVVYQSDTGATGKILHANSVAFVVQNYSNTKFDLELPVYNTNDTAVQKTGKVYANTDAANVIVAVSITATKKSGKADANTVTANIITSNTATDFLTEFAINDFIRLGTSNNNIRKITGRTASAINLETPLNITANVVSENVYRVTSSFLNDFIVNDFVRIGENANIHIRRITEVTPRELHVDVPLEILANLISQNVYSIPAAVWPESITSYYSEGNIIYTNLNSAELTYSGVEPVGKKFILGELITLVNESNTSLGSTATLSYTNSSVVILSDVSAPFVKGSYFYGDSSKARAYIDSVDSYPNITLQINSSNGFLTGSSIYVKNNDENFTPVGNAFIVSKSSSPDALSEYIISPRVDIRGDGNGAYAYSVVDLSPANPHRAITNIVLFNSGQNYTQANVVIQSNNDYGRGAMVQVNLSPVAGHGADVYSELGSTYCGISKKFNNALTEEYIYPMYGSYRTVGIIKNPLYRDVLFDLVSDSFDRSSIKIENKTGTFANGEILFQQSSNAAGIVVSSNATYIQLKNTKGTFTANATGDKVYGLSSHAYANSKIFTTKYFTLTSNLASISETIPGGTAQINQVISNTQIRATRAVGSFANGDSIYEPSTNAYGVIEKIYTANGLVEVSTNFGQRINQTARITLTTNTRPFMIGEYIVQDQSWATGRVISTLDEIDLVYVDNVPFAVGDIIINDNKPGANAIVIWANNDAKYLKLSSVSKEGFNEDTYRAFEVGDVIQNQIGSKVSTINNVYTALILDDVNYISGLQTTPYLGIFTVDRDKPISSIKTEAEGGSGAHAIVTLEHSVRLPELIRETGKVIYMENLQKFDKSPTSTEQVKLVIKF